MSTDRRRFLKAAGGMAALTAMPSALASTAGVWASPKHSIAGLAQRLDDEGRLAAARGFCSGALAQDYLLGIEAWSCAEQERPDALAITVAVPQADGSRRPVHFWSYQKQPVENVGSSNQVRLSEMGVTPALLIERYEGSDEPHSLVLPFDRKRGLGSNDSGVYVLANPGRHDPVTPDWSALRLNRGDDGWHLRTRDLKPVSMEYLIIEIKPAEEVQHV